MTHAHAREDFLQFWAVYPKHVSRLEAIKAWNKLDPSPELVAVILAAVAEQKRWPQWTKDDGAYIPHASTFLNQERWTDERTTSRVFR